MQTEIREEVASEENIIKFMAVNGVEMMSRDYVHMTSHEGCRSQAKSSKY